MSRVFGGCLSWCTSGVFGGCNKFYLCSIEIHKLHTNEVFPAAKDRAPNSIQVAASILGVCWNSY